MICTTDYTRIKYRGLSKVNGHPLKITKSLKSKKVHNILHHSIHKIITLTASAQGRVRWLH
jgi:hypothetical protein